MGVTNAIVHFVMIGLLGVYGAQNSEGEGMGNVNIAKPEWGTRITASTVFSAKYDPANLADGGLDGPHCWFGQDGATLPQHVDLAFAEPHRITSVRVVQAQWNGLEYRTKSFDLLYTTDGLTWLPLGAGTLASDTGATFESSFEPVEARGLRVVITDGYDMTRPCGFAEIEVYAVKPARVKPPFEGAARDIRWDQYGRHFMLHVELEPPAALWLPQASGAQGVQHWNSDAYRLAMTTVPKGANSSVVTFGISREDGQPFRVLKHRIEVKTSYAGIYKIFTPLTMAQQSYKIDLPFRIDGLCRAENETPVIWMQETDGHNTLTFGMLDQTPLTRFEGSTYDPTNGGEAPGIANSYARAGFLREPQHKTPVAEFRDGFYVSADTSRYWYEILAEYAAAVDAWRALPDRPVGKNALRSMWHSWYAHADKIDQAQLLDDARRAAALGVQALEIDAGWNIPPDVGYAFEVEGDYVFDSTRFPDPVAMVDAMHELNLAVVLHVAPLLMGPRAKAYAQMEDCILYVDGKATPYLDPRLEKTRTYLLESWECLMGEYKMDGLWYDFLELADEADPPKDGVAVISLNLHEAYTQLMQALHDKAIRMNPDAVIILRRGSANLNAKAYCTHVWPMDTPQDYHMNRRDIVYLKTFGENILTHACCTSWPISESDENVARQMSSITLAGVPAFSVKLAESPESHNAIIRAWLEFYNRNKEDLVLGRMTPLLPTPPSAALRIEGERATFVGFFEAVPGLVPLTKPADRVVIVNAFSARTTTRLEGLTGRFSATLYDQGLNLLSNTSWSSEGDGLSIDVTAPSRCSMLVLERL